MLCRFRKTPITRRFTNGGRLLENGHRSGVILVFIEMRFVWRAVSLMDFQHEITHPADRSIAASSNCFVIDSEPIPLSNELLALEQTTR